MAANAKIGVSMVLDGEKEYRAALDNIKAGQKELRSEMLLSQEVFGDQQNSLEALEERYGILTRQIDKQKEKIDVYQQAITHWNSEQQQAAEKVEKLRTALGSAEKEMDALKGSTGSSTEAINKQKETIQELQDKLALAEQGYDKAGQKTASYQAAVNSAQRELIGMERELSQTGEYLEEARSSTDHCAQSIDQYGHSTEDATGKTRIFGDVLKANLLSEAVRSGLRELADGIREAAEASVDAGSSFEASMSQVAATMGMTAAEVRSGSREYSMLADAAKDAGKTTIFSATQAGEALNYLALAGYDAQKSAAMLPKTLDLAAAGGLDLAYATDLATDSASALNLRMDQMDGYLDQMAKTSQKSNTSIAQLGEATLACAGTVSLAKQDLVTMNAELGILANNGIKGAEGGTHLRNIILALTSPTETAAAAFRRLGVDTADSNGDMRDLNDILTDLDASMEGMSSIERTRMISRIFNKTDIAAVNALLKGTGDEFDNLHREISDSAGAAKDMAEAMNDNLKGKVTILQSALEGLGISAYEVFDDTMKGAVDSATDAVGRLQRSVESGSMRVSLDRLSRSLAGFVDSALDVGEDALPMLMDGFSWILDHADLVTAGIAGITAAQLEMKVAAPAIEAATKAWQLYKSANEAATVSQWLLNAAANAFPGVTVVTAITAIVAGFTALAIANRNSRDAMDDLTKAAYDQIEAAKSLDGELASAAAGRDADRASMEAEAANCRSLVAELKELQAKTGLTSSEQARMRMIVEELNRAMPDLNLQIDEQTNVLNMSTDALESNVEAMMALSRVEAAREDLGKIAEEQYEAEKQLLELREQLEAQTLKAAEAEEAFAEAEERGQRQAADEAFFIRQEAITAQEDLEEQIRATTDSMGALADEYEWTLDYIASGKETVESAAEGMSKLGAAADGIGVSMAGMSMATQETLTEMYDSVSEMVTGQIDIFSEFNGAAKLSTEELLSNMQAQVEGVRQWSENLESLAERGISQGLLQHLADLGPEGAGYVAAFVSMTEEELQKANGLYEESLSLPDEAAEKITDAYAQAGEAAARGYEGGIRENAEDTVRAGVDMAAETLEGTKNILNAAAGGDVGRTLTAGLQGGIAKGSPGVVNISRNMAEAVLATQRSVLAQPNFEAIGGQMCTGLEQGIRNGQSGVVRAVEEMCTAAVVAAQRSLDIHSPSGKFRFMGEMSGEGYKVGWKESMDDIDRVIASAMPDAVLNPMPGSTDTGSPSDSAWQGDAGWIRDKYEINNNINVYAPADDPIEMARQIEKTQREMGRSW
ncbi:MAG: phage tail tape measure protein [Lachnospiraceae bacterium]|nr:phage tail tape measure protein [Lachnospiraceae bacterium]MCM1239954.1 phage tail tape measure protein [Lachnospiraceae bacterium]